MKRVIFILGLSLCVHAAFAQSSEDERTKGTTTKNGQYILPQAGDFAIGIDASNGLKYLGNIFNGNANNNHVNIFSFEDNVFDGQAIFGKYFLTDQSAIRVKLHLGNNSVTDKNFVRDDAAYKADNATEKQVEDSYKTSQTGFGLRAGYELRRGYGRLQGFFGGEAGIGFSSNSKEYEFGNHLHAIDGGATSTIWNSGNSFISSRTLEDKSGTTFSGLIGGFVGVEYFIAPKLSIGGEFNLSIITSSTGEGKTVVESVDFLTTPNTIKKKETESAGRSSSEFSTFSSGSLNVTFHF